MSFVKDPSHVEVLRRTEKLVGHLYPVIVDEDTGIVLSGRHRKFANNQWEEMKVKVKDDLHKELIILLANVQRQVAEEETALRFLRIARILEKRGVPKNQISAKMADLLDGIYHQNLIIRLLPAEYKLERKTKVTSSVKSSLSTKLDETAKEVRTALDIRNTLTGDTYAFLDCKCRQCDHKENCGHPPDTQ
jgi:hypothetical protein